MEEREHDISVALDTGINDKLQDMQLKLENTMLEKKKVAEVSFLRSCISQFLSTPSLGLGITDIFALSCR
jgi:hypothetical protein